MFEKVDNNDEDHQRIKEELLKLKKFLYERMGQ